MKNTVLFFSLLILILSGCALEKNSAFISPKLAQDTPESGNQNRKIIYDATLTISCKNIDSTSSFIERVAKKNQGYIYESNSNLICLRVVSDSLYPVIHTLASSGKVINKNIKSTDVTSEYTDYTIRLENAEKTRNRYLELLTKAENVQATIAVEKELERINETIDLLKGKINKINQLDTFATLKVYLKETKKPGILGYIGIGIYQSIKWLFIRN